MTFLKGTFVKMEGNSTGWMWVRLPSFLLKFFKARRDFRLVPGIHKRGERLTAHEAADRYLAMSAKSWRPFCHLPGIREFIDKWALTGDKLCEVGSVNYDRFSRGLALHQKRVMAGQVHSVPPQAWHLLANHYGVTPDIVDSWCEELSKIRVGDVSNHPMWFALGVDYA